MYEPKTYLKASRHFNSNHNPYHDKSWRTHFAWQPPNDGLKLHYSRTWASQGDLLKHIVLCIFPKLHLYVNYKTFNFENHNQIQVVKSSTDPAVFVCLFVLLLYFQFSHYDQYWSRPKIPRHEQVQDKIKPRICSAALLIWKRKCDMQCSTRGYADCQAFGIGLRRVADRVQL